mmetsp:Transcript_3109/g.9222  ORF Transcript_3109/g.9222 Transcript_3109/m.9222 type:complete len:265 (+) Transcript_3109:82-876(+)|eukprot:CAMPEP_0197476162 /NCGR_PEP_ID=MMETSP1309-20131121/7488_1 /TAXON_ID=464262 /ORGANISM="Genus nov. species nov., Strain RCC998" /LENGTH=264 /DNA_ID=CAMNT_0043016347 /DNA_START=68 /DNA_END=862 /DNA_ORIENTATION=-
MAAQAVAKAESGNPLAWVQNKQKAAGAALQTWIKKQPPYVEVAVATFGGATQGGVLGGVMGTMSKMSPPPPNGAAGPLAGGQSGMSTMMGGPLTQARNFAVMTGTHALIGTTIKKLRNGVEDVKGNMAASFGSGACFSLVSGVGGPNPIPNAISTGVVFALFQGAFYQIGKQFSKGKKGDGAAVDAAYFRTDQMLDTLGLVKYKKNFRRGMLSDTTLPLLTDSALHEVHVPAGPRLLILDHARTYKNYYKQDLAKRAVLLPKDQ